MVKVGQLDVLDYLPKFWADLLNHPVDIDELV